MGRRRRHGLYAAVFGAILAAVTFAGLEGMAALEAPPWPARALRSTAPVNPLPADAAGLAGKPWLSEPFNSWGMRDRERSVTRPAGVSFRSVFIGDSYLEFQLTRRWLAMEVERRFVDAGAAEAEVINLGISGTGPRSYHYRLRDVGLALKPDVVAVFFFSGNDFVYHGSGHGEALLPPLVDESPGGSILGSVMPRANWVLVNRLSLSEVLATNRPVAGEFETLVRLARGPVHERTAGLSYHVRRYYYPDMPESRLAGIFGRNSDSFWRPFGRRESDEEFLQGWLPNLMVKAEIDPSEYFDVVTREQAARLVKSGDIEATLSWLVAMDREARSRGVPFVLFVIPPASVDPDYAAFWKPWPRFYAFNVVAELRHERLLAALAGTTVRFVDLRKDLADVRGAYRKTDAHWTERGVAIAADRVFAELREIAGR